MQIYYSHRFIRDENDNIHMQLFLTLHEALLGFRTHVPHVSGKSVVIERQGITVEGYVIRIPGKGMPKRKATGSFGDLLVKIRVRFPAKQFSRSEVEILQKLMGSSTGFKWIHIGMPNSLHKETV